MKKTFLYGILVVVMLIAVALAGCAKPPAEPAAPAEPEAPAEPVELIHSTPNPEQHPVGFIFKAWGDDMEAFSNGQLKIVYNWAGGLGDAKDHYDMTINRVCDWAEFPVGWAPGRFPLSEIPALPIRGHSAAQCGQAIMEVVEKGYLDKEHSEVKLLVIGTTAPQKLFSKEKITSLADLEGLKIRCLTQPETALVKALGGVPTPMPITEVFMAMDRGVIDASFADYASAGVFTLFEAAPYVVELNTFSTPVAFVMNKDWWDSAPPDVKAGVEKSLEGRVLAACGLLDSLEAKSKAACLEGGIEVVEFTSADYAKLEELAQPILDEWVNSKEAEGYPAMEALEAYIAGLEKYKPAE